MNPLLLPVLSTLTAGGLAGLCYVLLYRDSVLLIQRPFFFRIGVGALFAAVIGTSAFFVAWIPTHLIHAVFAISVAVAVHAVHRGLHPDTEAWFYSLFRT
jgi:disulfide bond formation protein DsbB